jgi:hypothetical protein
MARRKQYAVLYNEDHNNFAIIFRSTEMPLYHWTMYQDEITKPEVADAICASLNNTEARGE